MKDERSIDQIKADNHEHFMKRGPALSYAYGHYVVAKDTAKKCVLLGGLGSMGVGRMWFDMTEDKRYQDYPGWDEAEEKDSHMDFGTTEAHDAMIQRWKDRNKDES